MADSKYSRQTDLGGPVCVFSASVVLEDSASVPALFFSTGGRDSFADLLAGASSALDSLRAMPNILKGKSEKVKGKG
jgi:hypothetical protein